MATDFTKVKPFKWWCHKVLPLVYEDSLSYYELLCKVVAKMNEIIGEYDSFEEAIEELNRRLTEVEGLNERVNVVETDLNEVEEKLEQLLNEMRGGTQGQVLAKGSDSDWDFDWITVASAHGIPSGGTNGQVLAKASNTDYDVEWVTGGGSGSEVVQTTGQSTTAVMSQKAVTDNLNNKLNTGDIAQTTGQSTEVPMSQKAVTDNLDNYVAKDSLEQTTGQSTTATMSQKAITDAIAEGGGSSDDKMDKVNPTGSGNLSVNGTIASGSTKCVALGDATVQGISSFGLGDYCRVNGNYSGAIGTSNDIEGDNDFATGINCDIEGSFGVAMGSANTVSGDYSVAIGDHVKASANNQIVIGRYNVEDSTGTHCFIVGDGSGVGNEKNVLAINKASGDLRIKGNIYYGCDDNSGNGIMINQGPVIDLLWSHPGGILPDEYEANVGTDAWSYKYLFIVTTDGYCTTIAITRTNSDMYGYLQTQLAMGSDNNNYYIENKTRNYRLVKYTGVLKCGTAYKHRMTFNNEGGITKNDSVSSYNLDPWRIYGVK